MNNNYVIINNQAYDPVTGLPVEGYRPAETSTAPEPISTTSAKRLDRGVEMPNIHRRAQHSATLSRRYVKKPLSLSPVDSQDTSQPIVAAYSPVNLSQFTVQQADQVQKFDAPVASVATVNIKDRQAEAHPVARRVQGRSLDIAAPQHKRSQSLQKRTLTDQIIQTQNKSPQTSAPKPAHMLKNEAIYEAMQKEMAPQKKTRMKKQRTSARWGRFMSMATASLAIIFLAGYFTYLNMPNLSMKMAAIQSGIDAKYPNYSPDGYALSGPISFRDGEVSMKFAYADGGRNFTLTQSKSSWDSSAVREYVDTKAKNPATTQIDGLTIYTYDSNAAWVNGGILYTLEGNAPLSSDQVQRIATSI